MSEFKTIATWCPECDCEVVARLEPRREELPVKGEPTVYDAEVAVCPDCGCVIGDSRIEDKNLKRVYDAYCSAHGLISPSEIHDLRLEYNLSLREFSKFLGFGEQTIARYESGAIPDESHSTTLMLASKAAGAASLLSVRQNCLSERTIHAVRSFIQRRTSFGNSDDVLPLYQRSMREKSEPCRFNGFRSFDMSRIAAVIYELAARCDNLYYTKLQKAMFFTDFFCYAKTARSMTGLVYIHEDYGPVMDDRGRIIAELQDRGVVELHQKGWGEVVLPKSCPENILNSEEVSLIAKVASFVNTFSTATEISDFSHRLDGWANTIKGQTIDYPSSAAQVEGAIEYSLSE